VPVRWPHPLHLRHLLLNPPISPRKRFPLSELLLLPVFLIPAAIGWFMMRVDRHERARRRALGRPLPRRSGMWWPPLIVAVLVVMAPAKVLSAGTEPCCMDYLPETGSGDGAIVLASLIFGAGVGLVFLVKRGGK